MGLLGLLLLAALAALAYAMFNFFSVKHLEEGNERMQQIAAFIRGGANTFIRYEYRVLALVVLIVAVVVAVVLDWYVACALLLGSVMSALAGFVGMKIATYSNVRVTNEANKTKNIGATLKVAFKGGSVMGLCVGGFALLGLFIVIMVFGKALGFLQPNADGTSQMAAAWLTKITFPKFPQTLSGYALGCSLVAMFNRVGGGIYTKAADMGADLVGKTEAHIPEDDPRNPATIADNVGDNVGDVAGLGSDLLESYVASIVATVVLAYSIVRSNPAFLEKLFLFPVAFAAVGLIGCVLGIATICLRNLGKVKNVHTVLNMSTWISAGITLIGGLVLSKTLFAGNTELAAIGFKFGWISPWVGAAVGVIAGILIGIFAEYYTSSEYKPTRVLAESSKEGAALTITSGLALGMRSCMAPCIILGVGIIVAYYIAGLYGVGMSAMGMLSFVAATVAVDTYGPISDNAGGIAEMSQLEESVREITDELDAVGNTTAAIGKGFAIGSGGLAALSLMLSYLYAYHTPEAGSIPSLNIVQPMTLAGAIIGGALPFLFSGMLIDAVAIAARKMVDEVRRQFTEKPEILEGKADPDHNTCIAISTKGSIGQMKVPALMAVIIPVIAGLLFGADFVGGILIGSTICAIMIAIFTGNAGGAWDNGKKFIEQGGIPGAGKGSPVHDAAVVGDTVGDPLKDTVGPCMDIFIKIMSTVSLVAVVVFNQYNLWRLIFG